jgi:plastocyanin
LVLGLWPDAAFAGDPVGGISGTVAIIPVAVGSQVTGADAALVYLEDAPAGAPLPRGPFVVTQEGKAFDPPLLVVPLGATVEFPNRDAFFHNVFSTASGNAFDLGLYKGGDSKSVVFAKPGWVPVFCNIHPQMLSYILVVTNGFFTRPAPDGRFSFADVPPGTYHIAAWFPYGSVERREVRVEAAATADVRLVLRERSGAGRHLNKDGKPYQRYLESR